MAGPHLENHGLFRVRCLLRVTRGAFIGPFALLVEVYGGGGGGACLGLQNASAQSRHELQHGVIRISKCNARPRKVVFFEHMSPSNEPPLATFALVGGSTDWLSATAAADLPTRGAAAATTSHHGGSRGVEKSKSTQTITCTTPHHPFFVLCFHIRRLQIG